MLGLVGVDVLYRLHLLGQRDRGHPVRGGLISSNHSLPCSTHFQVVLVMRIEMHFVDRGVVPYIVRRRLRVFLSVLSLDLSIMEFSLRRFRRVIFFFAELILSESILRAGVSKFDFTYFFCLVQLVFFCQSLSPDVDPFDDNGGCCLACVIFVDRLDFFFPHFLHLDHLSDLFPDLRSGFVGCVDLYLWGFSVVVLKI